MSKYATKITKESQNYLDASKLFEQFDAITAKNDRMLRSLKPLTWSSPDQVCRSYRWMLHFYIQWIHIRKQYINVRQKIYELDRALMERIGSENVSYALGYEQYRRRYRWGASSNDATPTVTTPTVTAQKITEPFPVQEEFSLVQAVHKRLEALNETLDRQYAQMAKECSLPNYMEIKKQLCYGWHHAHSLLLACKTGRPNDNKDSQKWLFGWKCDHNSPNERATDVMRLALRNLHPRMREDKNHRVSVTAGYRLMDQGRMSKSDVLITRKHDSARDRWTKLLSRNVAQKNVLDLLPDCSFTCRHAHQSVPLMAEYVRREVQRDGGKDLRIRNRVLLKIMQIASVTDSTNSVFTIPVDSPIHLGGDDYAVLCMWGDEGNAGNGYNYSNRERNQHRIGIRLGWVYLRRGWNDVYHVAVQDTQKSWTLEQKIEHAKTKMLEPAIAANRLDNASNSFFNNRRDPSLSGLTVKVRRARILKKVRLVPALSRKDSYDVSNCVPGTEQFIADLERMGGKKLGDGQTVSGREIAKAWRKGGYIQEDRFSNVVNRLHKAVIAEQKRRDAIDAQLDARILEAMDTDGGYVRAVELEVHHGPYVPQAVIEERLQDDGSYVPVMTSEVSSGNSEVIDVE